MIVAHELGSLGNGEFLRREATARRRDRGVAQVRRAERAKIQAMTPAQRAAWDAKQKAAQLTGQAEAAERLAWRREWDLGPEKGRQLGTANLTARGKVLRGMIIRRDWNALFKLIPVKQWPRHWSLSKYSFTGDGANKRYKAWSQADLKSFIFSPYYTVQPGYTCTDEQRTMGVAAYLKAQGRHKQKFGPTIHHYVWPIYPGGGYGSQRYGCEKYRPSTWVKIRKPVAIAALVVVGGILVGKALVAASAKAASAKAATAAAAGKAGLVGVGAKAGVVTAVTTKATVGALATKAGTLAALKTGAGTAAAVAAAAGGAATGATTAGGIVGWAAKAAPMAEKIINGTRTVKALADGELPPPPISLGDGSLTDYATVVGEKLAEREMRRKLTRAEAAALADMIESERQYLARAEPTHLPVVNSGLDPALTAAQRTRADGAVSEGNLVKLLAVGVPALLLFAQG